MKATYQTPNICVITNDELCAVQIVTGSPAASTGGRAKQGSFGLWDDDESDNNASGIYHNGNITAGGFESSIPKSKSVWDD